MESKRLSPYKFYERSIFLLSIPSQEIVGFSRKVMDNEKHSNEQLTIHRVVTATHIKKTTNGESYNSYLSQLTVFSLIKEENSLYRYRVSAFLIQTILK